MKDCLTLSTGGTVQSWAESGTWPLIVHRKPPLFFGTEKYKEWLACRRGGCFPCDFGKEGGLVLGVAVDLCDPERGRVR